MAVPYMVLKKAIIETKGIDEQVAFLTSNVPGLSKAQAKLILEAGFKRNSSVVIGGSRIRGNYNVNSDLDVGFGGLSKRQAERVVKDINKKNYDLHLEDRIRIVPGVSTQSIKKIESPEEFFQRSGIRSHRDIEKAGQPYKPSGSVTLTPDGKIIVIPPGAKP